MNAWAFGTVVLITFIVVAGVLLDRIADRGHEIRWHERFYQPQLPHRTRRIIDVDVGSGAWGVPQPHVEVGVPAARTRKTAPQR